MKKSIWLFASMLTVFVACKDDDADTPNAISSEEAAVMVGSSFASNSSGVSLVSKESANKSEDILEENANGRIATCGISQTIDLSGASPVGGTITWSYDFSYKFRLNCNTEELPDNITVALTYNGNFDGPKLAFEHSGLSELALTGLEESDDHFVLDGSYKRSGSFEIKEGEKAGSSSIEITLTTVAIDKSTHKITSGSSSFLLTGSVSGKGSFKYTGTVEFNGNDTAKLKIKSETFLLNLNDGSVTAQ
ncbi:MAG: hypothetical protein ABI663_02890 [Chryseolinea sp.]